MMVLGFLAVAVPILANWPSKFCRLAVLCCGALPSSLGVAFTANAGLCLVAADCGAGDRPRPGIDPASARRCSDPDDGTGGVLRHRGHCFDRRRDRASAASAKLGLGAVQRHHRFAARLFDLGRLAELGELGDRPSGRHQHALPRIVPGDDRARSGRWANNNNSPLSILPEKTRRETQTLSDLGVGGSSDRWSAKNDGSQNGDADRNKASGVGFYSSCATLGRSVKDNGDSALENQPHAERTRPAYPKEKVLMRALCWHGKEGHPLRHACPIRRSSIRATPSSR